MTGYKTRRSTNACLNCRQSKVRCSGLYPCENCLRRSLDCIPPDNSRKVTVSERYLRFLQNQTRRLDYFETTPTSWQHDSELNSNDFRPAPRDCLPSQTKERRKESPSERNGDEALNSLNSISRIPKALTSPFTLPSMTMKNQQTTSRGWVYLGPSSAASLTARLVITITQQLHHTSPSDIPIQLDGEVYKLEIGGSDEETHQALRGIPSLDYSLHLFSTVKFHLNYYSGILDEKRFVPSLHEFYDNAREKMTKSRLWYTQFMLVLAFGNALLPGIGKREQTAPPGAAFFKKAIALLPTQLQLWDDPLLAVEVLLLAGLYLYSVDKKESAYLYLGQAVRMCLMEGLHTELPRDEIGIEAWKHGHDLWWTVYILDRHLTSILGVPISVQDSDITTPLQDQGESSRKDALLILQVKISQLLSTIVQALFRFERVPGKLFIGQTVSTLNALASLAQELESIFKSKFRTSIDSPSKATLRLSLLNHRCIILAMQPLFWSVLRCRLEKIQQNKPLQPIRSKITDTLISTGIESALKTLKILTVLKENNLLDIFLPFDLEFAMAAGSLLVLADVLYPDSVECSDHRDILSSILVEMIQKGNKVAESRQAELSRLTALCDELRQHERSDTASFISASGNSQLFQAPLAAAVGQDNVRNAPCPVETRPSGEYNMQGTQNEQETLRDSTFTNNSSLIDFGLSSDNLLSVVEQIEGDCDMTQLDPSYGPLYDLTWEPAYMDQFK